jgi:putative aminopeptidase FrvX
MTEPLKPWTQSMPDEQFARMRHILSAPSPVGLEASMTYGVLKPMIDAFKPPSWGWHAFKGSASLVLDTHPDASPGDLLTIMLIGHADKIRLQVRSIGDDGKIWINSDSFLPQTLLGHEVLLFSEAPDSPGSYRVIEGGTVEALGAIHLAPPKLREGDLGVKANQLYLDLQLHGDKRRAQVEALGVKPGDPLILNRPIKRGFSPDSFYGAYLDNGLGCFAVEEIARLVASRNGPGDIRVLFAFATHEEIGRMGSRVLAGELKPDAVIAIDVNHDFASAPGISDRRLPPLSMGKGFTLDIGAVTSAYLNSLIQQAARSAGTPFMLDVVGRDTGTDAMAAVFAAIDAASASVGFPIRNMHTISETAHTGDVLASIHALDSLLSLADQQKLTPNSLRSNHPRLDLASPLSFTPPTP